MKILQTSVLGAHVVELEPFSDERGLFARAFCAEEFAAHGISAQVTQTNLSYNRRRGTMRGLHAQRAPHEEAKLVRCVRGAIFDVAVDVRPDSPTYLQHVGVELTADNRRALLVPEGCLHGFLTLADDTEVLYQVSEPYAPGMELGARFDDPAFAIPWPAPVALLSDKDAAWAPFQREQAR